MENEKKYPAMGETAKEEELPGPPAGVTPQHQWQLQRSVDLAEAIGRYAHVGLLLHFNKRVRLWATELAELLEEHGFQYHKDLAEEEKDDDDDILEG
jgi:hypothetical protein